MRTLFGLAILAALAALAVWGIGKATSGAGSTSSAAKAGALQATEQAKEAVTEVADARSGMQAGIYEGVTGEAPPETGAGSYAYSFFTSGPIGLAYEVYENNWGADSEAPDAEASPDNAS